LYSTNPGVREAPGYLTFLSKENVMKFFNEQNMKDLHRSFQATREYMIPLAKLHPLTVGTVDNFRRQAVLVAMRNLGIPQFKYETVSSAYKAWRRACQALEREQVVADTTEYEEGEGPCVECGETREENAPCWNCNIL
tara:strand:+ start:2750 stop:3163 length:414 start_codon:yes stop_codon:yes gene_type:complete